MTTLTTELIAATYGGRAQGPFGSPTMIQPEFYRATRNSEVAP